jgi:hypothetical protein
LTLSTPGGIARHRSIRKAAAAGDRPPAHIPFLALLRQFPVCKVDNRSYNYSKMATTDLQAQIA